MGVWIEIIRCRYVKPKSVVTPFMGVWIEMLIPSPSIGIAIVTPFMGVWIEIITTLAANTVDLSSLPLWECGLKLPDRSGKSRSRWSLPLWECGLK